MMFLNVASSANATSTYETCTPSYATLILEALDIRVRPDIVSLRNAQVTT